jgi:hypothetical protein
VTSRPFASTLDRVVLILSMVAWSVTLSVSLGWVRLAGCFTLGLYPYYALAVGLGWVLGNVYVWRARRVGGMKTHKWLLVIYLIGPPGALYLLRALALERAQALAPLAPTWALGTYVILFFVPVTLRHTGRQ